MTRRAWGFLLVLVLLCLAALSLSRPAADWFSRMTTFLADREGARAWFLSFQPYTGLYFVGLQALQVVVSLVPGELTGLLGGYIFGASLGFVYSTIGLTLGTTVAVLIGRFFERVFVERLIPARLLNGMGHRVDRWGLVAVFAFYLIPGLPKDSVCYLVGLSRLPLVPFILVSSVARMPGTLWLVLQGAHVLNRNWGLLAIFTLAVLAACVPVFLFRRRIQARFGLGPDTE